MSLLNQVLRDLDRRQAPNATGSSKAGALLPRAAAPGRRAARWALGGAATAAAVIAGGLAQGSLKWPHGAPAAQVAVAQPVTPAPVPMAARTPAPTALAAASAAATITTPIAARPVHDTAQAQVAIAAPAVRNRAPAPRTSDDDASHLTALASTKVDARIELRTPAHTAQERAETHYQRGVSAHQAGLIADSAAAFTAALREDPRHVAARIAQAGVLIGQARNDEALALLTEGLDLAPAHPQLALMFARMLADREEWARAAETLAAAHAKAVDNAEFQASYGAILQRAGRHADAVEKYGLALRLAPNRSVWWMGLAISLEAIGQTDAARTAFQRARSIGLPESAAGYVDARLKQLG